MQKRMTGKYRDAPIISDPAKNDIALRSNSLPQKDKSTRLLADKRFPMGVDPIQLESMQGFKVYLTVLVSTVYQLQKPTKSLETVCLQYGANG